MTRGDAKEQVIALTGGEGSEGLPMEASCPACVLCQACCQMGCRATLCSNETESCRDTCSKCTNRVVCQGFCRPLCGCFHVMSNGCLPAIGCFLETRLRVAVPREEYEQWGMFSRCFWSSFNSLMCLQCNPWLYWAHPCEALFCCWPIYDCVLAPIMTMPCRLLVLFYNLLCVLPVACCYSCVRVPASESRPLKAGERDVVVDTFPVGPPFGISSGGCLCLPSVLRVREGDSLSFFSAIAFPREKIVKESWSIHNASHRYSMRGAKDPCNSESLFHTLGSEVTDTHDCGCCQIAFHDHTADFQCWESAFRTSWQGSDQRYR